MRMRPSFSSTNRRPLPSPACVSCTGSDRPDTGSESMALDRMRTSRHATHPSCRVGQDAHFVNILRGIKSQSKDVAVSGKVAVKTVPDHDIPRPFHPDLVRGRAGRHLRHDQFDLVHQPQMAQIYVNPLWGKVRGSPPGINVAVSCKVLVPTPVRYFTVPSYATFTIRLSCVIGIACATLWVWVGAQEVINSAASAMMCFILPFLRLCHFRKGPSVRRPRTPFAYGWRGACPRRCCYGTSGRVRPGCRRRCWPGRGRGGRW